LVVLPLSSGRRRSDVTDARHQTSDIQGRPPISYYVELFDDTNFHRSTYEVFNQIVELLKDHPKLTSRPLIDALQPFFRRWKALPAFSLFELQYRPLLAVLSGKWGAIPIFPWTTGRDVARAVRKIRRTIGKTHQDAATARRGILAEWLELHGFTRAEIAQAVWGRTTGLRRPSREEVTSRLSEEREAQIIGSYQRGLTRSQAVRKFWRIERGSEPLAGAAVRMAVTRSRKFADSLRDALRTPKECDALAWAISQVLRHDYYQGDPQRPSPTAAAFWKALGLDRLLFHD
jgi:hypothetical protein